MKTYQNAVSTSPHHPGPELTLIQRCSYRDVIRNVVLTSVHHPDVTSMFIQCFVDIIRLESVGRVKTSSVLHLGDPACNAHIDCNKLTVQRHSHAL